MNAVNKTNNQIEYISVLNVLACISVIALHCNRVFWQRPDGILWISANFIETFFYFAVPIFFMLPGVTLFNYHEKYSTKEYFIKRSKKLIIPFLVWSLINYVFLK